MTENKPPSELFDAYYYAHDCGAPYERSEVWLKQFAAFAERIVQDIAPTTVLDAGCAWGFLVEMLRRREVQAWGVDISEYAIANVHPDMRMYCRVGSITQPFTQPHYDLIVCIEVLEHLQKPEAEQALVNLCQHSDDILFSSTPHDYQEATHFNVQPPEVWAELFARQGFFRDVDFDASFITPWAARFRRQEMPLTRLVSNYERRFVPLWKENVDLRHQVNLTRNQLGQLEHRLPELEQENQALRLEIEKAAAEYRAMATRLNQTEQDLAEMRAQLQSILNSRRFKLALLLPGSPKRPKP